MFSTPRSRVSTWEAGTAAISGDLRVSVPPGRGGRHRIRQRGTLWGSQALLTSWADPSCNRCSYIFAMTPQAMRPPEPPMGCAIPPQVRRLCRAKVCRSSAGFSGTTGIAPRQATPTLPMPPCRSGGEGRSNHRHRDGESTPTTDNASTIAPQRSGSRSTSKACINPARPPRPCKRPPYAAPLRARRRRPFPLPRPPGPTPHCFRR